MDIHKISIPGLDYSYCENCKKWIIEDEQLEKLKEELAQANMGKESEAKEKFRVFVRQKIKEKGKCV